MTNIIAQLPEVIESLTGIDVIGSIRNLPGLRASNGDNADGTGSESTPPSQS